MFYLLDTNHCIYLKDGWRKKATERSKAEKNTISIFENITDDMVYMSEVTFGELIYGAEFSNKKEYSLSRVEVIKKAVPPISVDREVWSIFGKTKSVLRKEGKTIPDLDLLIASTAHRYNMTLVTNDKHMRMLPSSFIQENWSKIEIK